MPCMKTDTSNTYLPCQQSRAMRMGYTSPLFPTASWRALHSSWRLCDVAWQAVEGQKSSYTGHVAGSTEWENSALHSMLGQRLLILEKVMLSDITLMSHVVGRVVALTTFQ